jgi:hypothetical protein
MQARAVKRRSGVLIAGLIVVGISLACPSTVAAASERDSGACRPTISVAETVRDRDGVKARAHDAVCKTLREHDFDLAKTPAGSLVVDVSGIETHWIVSVAVHHEGTRSFAREDPAVCHCDDETMLAVVSMATAAAIPLMRREETPRSESDPSTTPSPADPLPPVPPPSPGLLEPLGTMGRTGIGLIAAGTAGTVIGIALVVSGSRVNGRVEREGQDLRPAGYALLGTSLALGITGAVLLGVDRRRARQRQAQIVPTLGPGHIGLGVSGRF